MEVHFGINVQGLLRLFGHDMVADIFLEATTELWDVLLTERQTYGIGVTTEVFEQVATRLDSLVDVEASHRTGRTRGNAVDDSQHDGRTEIEFRQS